MGAAHPIVVTGAAELQMQLDHPSAEIIRVRATEVFGNAEKADVWLHRRRRIFTAALRSRSSSPATSRACGKC